MKKLIKKYISKQDKALISSVTNYDINNLIHEVKDWTPFNNNAKHIITRFDKKGMHLLRSLLAEKIIDDLRESKFNALQCSEYTEFKETGLIIRHDIDINKDKEWIYKIISTFEGSNYGLSLKNFNVNNIIATSGYDIQHSPHIDTFQPSCKLWIYKNDMSLENGPFCYVKGSHRNSKEKLSLLYSLSTERSRKLLNISNDYEGSTIGRLSSQTSNLLPLGEVTASLRLKVNNSFKSFDPKDINKTLRSFNLNEETPITGETGTLCIADISGMHRRFKGLDGSVRRSVRWSSLRRNLNPFSL